MKRTRGYIIAAHCIGWIIFLSIPTVFIVGLPGGKGLLSLLSHPHWLYFLIYIFIFYLHTYFLFPKLYFAKKYLLYTLSMLVLAAAIYYLRPYDNVAMIRHNDSPAVEGKLAARQQHAPPGLQEQAPVTTIGQDKPAFSSPFPRDRRNRPKFDIISTVLFILIIALSITIVVIRRWRQAVEHASRIEADKANAELAILKAQINPHFLFNTLNNIYSQAVMQDEKTPESIMKLSNIMRYVTDDANNEFVSLLSESNFISDYIELQRLRLGSKVSLDFAINGKLEDKIIAPLILITFIENVFKYGISNNEPSNISIELRAYSDSIAFYSRNKLFPLKHQLESTGIGILNTKKRLDHLYPGKHTLTIKEEDGFFSVNLILQS